MRYGTVKSFDPVVAAVTGAQTLQAGAGGGLIGGNGTFYSLPTNCSIMKYLAEILRFTGTIAGTLTAEVDNNDGDAADLNGTADWQTYNDLQKDGFVDGVATLVAGAISGGTNPEIVELKPFAFGRFRWKLVVTGGTGTIRATRTVKG